MRSALQHIITFIERESYRIMVALILVILIAGGAYSYYLGDTLRYPDEQDYYVLATHLIDTGAYTLDGGHPTTARPPGYPAMLAALLALGRSISILRFANFVALGSSIYLLYFIGKAHGSALTACFAGILVCGYPVLFYTAGTLYPQTIAGCLLLGIIYCLFRKPQSHWNDLVVGLLFGWLILMIPTFVVILLACLVWLWFKDANKQRVIVALVAASLVVTFWMARNYLVFRSFVFVSSNSGLNLLLGNSENTTADGGVNVDISKYDAVAGNLDEIARDTYYRDQAIHYIMNNHRHVLRLYFSKLFNYFDFRNELSTISESSRIGDILMFATYGFMCCICLLRLVYIKEYPISSVEILVFLLYVVNALFSAIFFTRIRFRLPFDLMLIIVVARFLAYIVRRRLIPPQVQLVA